MIGSLEFSTEVLTRYSVFYSYFHTVRTVKYLIEKAICNPTEKGQNRAVTEFWNSLALGQCKLNLATGHQRRERSVWCSGSGNVSPVPGLGNALGVAGKKVFMG